jgi:hypothetical protein
MGMSQVREYVSLNCAVRLIATSHSHVKRLAEQRLIGTQKLPGRPVRYCRRDIISLRERCTVPATVDVDLELELVGA